MHPPLTDPLSQEATPMTLPIPGEQEPVRRTRNPFVQIWRGLILALLAFWEIALLSWAIIVAALCLIWIGVPLVKPTAALVHRTAHLQRTLAYRWNGVAVPERYEPAAGPAGWFGSLRVLRSFSDPTVVRDWVWILTDAILGMALGLFAIAAFAQGLWQIILSLAYDAWRVEGWDSWISWIYVGWPNASLLLAISGAAYLVLALLLAGALTLLHAHWTRFSLATRDTERLHRRLQQLSSTRSDAAELQQEEIRRIERDLHDGAQARLVGLGITLTRAERLLAEDPQAATLLLSQAKQESVGALDELRGLVRGILPPVLADRGLLEALRALAVTLPVPVSVEASAPFSAVVIPAPIESAAYFAGAELLSNAMKHADAQRVDLRLDATMGYLRLSVEDDGVGWDGREGGGISGLRRRLAGFDGTLTFSRTGAGGTRATVDVPLADF
ncbi:sensor histidine kinase [Galactobacter caseinivorans]|uniref:histidine kinase n=1 Tax=Galactobacter caseinivorans TaxID=2676123 RepID=A0A496PN66_9MICC|nr:sensor domain-containing protein [Galactobacter caseinivorans]RKW71906.1 sensor histidine kinase [Galactobacter caseinivorans]